MTTIIPDYLRKSNFVYFKIVRDSAHPDAKPRKLPYTIKLDGTRPAMASSTNPATWVDAETAEAFYNKYKEKFDRGEYVLAFVVDRPFGVIDLDDAFEDDGVTLKPYPRSVVNNVASYTEISPSGKGIHVIFKLSDWDRYTGKNTDGVEVYFHSRLMTLTGNVFENRDTLATWSRDDIERFTGLTLTTADESAHVPPNLIKSVMEKLYPARVRNLTPDDLENELHRVKLWTLEDYQTLARNNESDASDASVLDFYFVRTCGLLGCFDIQTIAEVYRRSPLQEWRERIGRKPEKGHDLGYFERTAQKALDPLIVTKLAPLFLPEQHIRFGGEVETVVGEDSPDVYLADTRFDSPQPFSNEIEREKREFLRYKENNDEMRTEKIPPYVNLDVLGAYLANAVINPTKTTGAVLWVSKSGTLRWINNSPEKLAAQWLYIIDKSAYVQARIDTALSLTRQKDAELADEAREALAALTPTDYESSLQYETALIDTLKAHVGITTVKKAGRIVAEERKNFFALVLSYLSYARQYNETLKFSRDYDRTCGLVLSGTRTEVTVYSNTILELPHDIFVTAEKFARSGETIPLQWKESGVLVRKDTLAEPLKRIDIAKLEATPEVKFYREHWGKNRLDELIEFFVAADLSPDTKQANLFIHADSNFGKSYLMTHHLKEYFYPLSLKHISGLHKGETVNLDDAQLMKVRAVYFDEVTHIPDKPFQSSTGKYWRVAPKYKNQREIQIGARIFLSADQPLPASEGADVQTINRLSEWELEGDFMRRAEKRGLDLYTVNLRVRLYLWLKLVETYARWLRRDDYRAEAVKWLAYFHAKYKIERRPELDVLNDRLTDKLIDDIYSAVVWYDLKMQDYKKNPDAPMFNQPSVPKWLRYFTLVYPHRTDAPLRHVPRLAVFRSEERSGLEEVVKRVASGEFHWGQIKEKRLQIPVVATTRESMISGWWAEDGHWRKTKRKVSVLDTLPLDRLKEVYESTKSEVEAEAAANRPEFDKSTACDTPEPRL